MTTTSDGGLFADAEIIHSYTRAQALEDGALVDVSELATEQGIRFPVAVTRTVWEDCCAWSEDERAPQDETGRVWDVITMLRFGIRQTAPGADRITFDVLRIPRGGDRPELAHLWAQCGPGDDAEPVITVMAIGED